MPPGKADPLVGRHPPPHTHTKSQPAVGMYPTAMHSCFLQISGGELGLLAVRKLPPVLMSGTQTQPRNSNSNQTCRIHV